jgi:regulator of protease activity HflC (stomatin/prohibitin superfamily)
MKIFPIVAAVFFGLIGVSIVGGSWYTVDQGYRAVLLRNGALVGTAQPGLGFKLPIVDSAIDISVQEHSIQYSGGENSSGLASYSFDQQPAAVRVSVNYRIPEDRVADVYVDFGGEEGLVNRILNPRVYQSVKNVFGQYTAVRAIQDRAKLNLDMLTALQNAIGDEPIVITGLQVENIDFSAAYEESIEQRMLAEVEVQKLRQNAERTKVEAEITVTKAQAEADSTLARAEAEAKSTTLRGEAEATAIRAKGAALRDNPALVSLIQAERWNGVLPTTMLPEGTVPFMTVGPKP